MSNVTDLDNSVDALEKLFEEHNKDWPKNFDIFTIVTPSLKVGRVSFLTPEVVIVLESKRYQGDPLFLDCYGEINEAGNVLKSRVGSLPIDLPKFTLGHTVWSRVN